MSARDDVFEAAGFGSTPPSAYALERAVEKVRAEALREASNLTQSLAFEFREEEDGEWSSREVLDAVCDVAGRLRRKAEEVEG